ncbi:MAG: hypothetical protein IKA62_06350 [Clostridia bacterium]|nr:hypothetical protein [Clostridia bacterium]
MKIKKIVDMCRREGTVKIFVDESGVQWLGNGYACYPLYDIPTLTEDEFYTIFDFTPKQRNETVFTRSPFPDSLCNDDIHPTDQHCDRLSQYIPFGSRLLIPFSTAVGIKFLDDEYLAPLVGETDKVEVFERTSKNGESYFAVKVGMTLRAIIMPFNAINKSFVDNIGEIYSLCKNALINKDAEQISAFDN